MHASYMPTAEMSQRPRRLPRMKAILAWWDLPSGCCIRCGAFAYTYRAHIIDRCAGGLDAVQNLVPLCEPCHLSQPAFRSGEEEAAFRWLNTYLWGASQLAPRAAFTVAGSVHHGPHGLEISTTDRPGVPVP